MADQKDALAKAKKAADAAGDVIKTSFKDAGMGAVRHFDLNVITEGSTVTVPKDYEIRVREFNGNKAAYVFTEEGQPLYISVFTRRLVAKSDQKVFKSEGEVVDAIQKYESLDEAFNNEVAGNTFLFAKKTPVETRFGTQNTWLIIRNPTDEDYKKYNAEKPAA